MTEPDPRWERLDEATRTLAREMRAYGLDESAAIDAALGGAAIESGSGVDLLADEFQRAGLSEAAARTAASYGELRETRRAPLAESSGAILDRPRGPAPARQSTAEVVEQIVVARVRDYAAVGVGLAEAKRRADTERDQIRNIVEGRR